jgi:hypothetical protein
MRELCNDSPNLAIQELNDSLTGRLCMRLADTGADLLKECWQATRRYQGGTNQLDNRLASLLTQTPAPSAVSCSACGIV